MYSRKRREERMREKNAEHQQHHQQQQQEQPNTTSKTNFNNSINDEENGDGVNNYYQYDKGNGSGAMSTGRDASFTSVNSSNVNPYDNGYVNNVQDSLLNNSATFSNNGSNSSFHQTAAVAASGVTSGVIRSNDSSSNANYNNDVYPPPPPLPTSSTWSVMSRDKSTSNHDDKNINNDNVNNGIPNTTTRASSRVMRSRLERERRKQRQQKNSNNAADTTPNNNNINNNGNGDHFNDSHLDNTNQETLPSPSSIPSPILRRLVSSASTASSSSKNDRKGRRNFRYTSSHGRTSSANKNNNSEKIAKASSPYLSSPGPAVVPGAVAVAAVSPTNSNNYDDNAAAAIPQNGKYDRSRARRAMARNKEQYNPGYSNSSNSNANSDLKSGAVDNNNKNGDYHLDDDECIPVGAVAVTNQDVRPLAKGTLSTLIPTSSENTPVTLSDGSNASSSQPHHASQAVSPSQELLDTTDDHLFIKDEALPPNDSANKKKGRMLAILGFCLFVVIAIVVIVVLVTKNGSNNDDSSNSDSMSSSDNDNGGGLEPDPEFLQQKSDLLQFVTSNGWSAMQDFDDEQSPQSLAIEHLAMRTNTMVDVDEYALSVIYYGLNGPDWVANNDANWLSGSSVCTWQHITCNFNNTVSEFNLPPNVNAFGATLPSEISHLSALQVLSLSSNGLVNIPDAIAMLPNLVYLDLSNNDFGEMEELPLWIYGFELLEHLALQGSSWMGTLSTHLGDLQQLTYLDIDSNAIGGELPSEIGLLSNLEYLYVTQNSLEGTLPSEIGSLVRLTGLSLAGNEFTGALPSEIENSSLLELFVVASPKISGRIDDVIRKLTNLVEIRIPFSPQFGGTIPTEIGLLSNLTTFDISSTAVTGVLPSEIGQLSMLDFFSSSATALSGTIPTEIGNLSQVRHFAITQRSKLTGTLPSEIGNMSSLQILELEFDSIARVTSIPIEISNLDQLTIIELLPTHNQVEIPDELCELPLLDTVCITASNGNCGQGSCQ